MPLLHKHDPGPCPVDDAPHTTCTSPDYDPTTPTLSQVQLRARDGLISPRRLVTYGTPSGALSTATWTRVRLLMRLKTKGGVS